jgi:hypothetical protein
VKFSQLYTDLEPEIAHAWVVTIALPTTWPNFRCTAASLQPKFRCNAASLQDYKYFAVRVKQSIVVGCTRDIHICIHLVVSCEKIMEPLFPQENLKGYRKKDK